MSNNFTLASSAISSNSSFRRNFQDWELQSLTMFLGILDDARLIGVKDDIWV